MPEPANEPFTTGRLFAVAQEQLTSDDYYTPRWVFDRMGLTFDLDVCAPPGGVEWVPAARYFTQADDGLAQPWEGRVWMNPPFSAPAPWIDRFMDHRHGVCLIQVSRGRYSSPLWAAADGLVFLADMFFLRSTARGGDAAVSRFDPAGMRQDIYMPLWFAAFGAECVEAIGRLGVVRRVE